MAGVSGQNPDVYLKKLLMQSTEYALEELGESSKQAILFFMQKEGVWTSTESFDIMNFDIIAHKLLHTGADVIMDRVYRHFQSAIASSKLAVDTIVNDDSDPDLSPLQKIKRIFEMANSAVRSNDGNYYG